MITTSIEKDPEFMAAFWDWFDSLDKSQKDMFNYYKLDFAIVNFYNTVWSRINNPKKD